MIINCIIDSDLLLTSYKGWRKWILRINQAWHNHQLEKHSRGSNFFNSNKIAKGDGHPNTITNTMLGSTSMNDLPQGGPMNVDRRKANMVCYKCQQKRHIAQNCPNQGKQRSMMEELQVMSEEEKTEFRKFFS